MHLVTNTVHKAIKGLKSWGKKTALKSSKSKGNTVCDLTFGGRTKEQMQNFVFQIFITKTRKTNKASSYYVTFIARLQKISFSG